MPANASKSAFAWERISVSTGIFAVMRPIVGLGAYPEGLAAAESGSADPGARRATLRREALFGT